jgi:hypothetical protein
VNLLPSREDRDVEWFHGTRWDKRLYVLIYPTFSLLFLGFVFNPGKGGSPLRVAVATEILVALIFAIRGARVGTVRADNRGVKAYGAVRRWDWAWSQIQGFSTAPGRQARAGALHQILLVSLVDGRTKRLSPINSRRSVSGLDSTWVDLAAQALNERLRQERGAARPRW